MVSIYKKRNPDNSYKGKTFNWGGLMFSKFQSIPIMVQHDSMQVDMVLEKQTSVLHFDFQTTGCGLSHYA